ncbi:MAG: F0F1 ATP synthase subunit epsilon [Clostridiales bacterium]|nr:F0F1 ATP synthase subunit epsilon [Clostridiales bacterium]
MAENEKHKINLLIVTPYEDFFEGLVDSVRIPTSDGEFGFMAGHTPFVAALEPGACALTVDGKIKYCMLSEGYCEINGMLALIVCNSAEWPENMRLRRIISAYNSAIEEIKTHQDKNGRPVFTEDSIAKGKRALARMRFIERYGTDQQRERLAGYKKSDFPGGVVPRLQ